jgi:transposase
MATSVNPKGCDLSIVAVSRMRHRRFLDREPAKYFVRVLRREKRARSSCAQGGVQTAGSPARIIEKSIVSDQVIIDTVVTKYCDYVPLYRQSAILEREVGLVWISLI